MGVVYTADRCPVNSEEVLARLSSVMASLNIKTKVKSFFSGLQVSDHAMGNGASRF